MVKKLTKEEFICGDCGYIGRGAVLLRGSAAVERLMWYALLLPGPLYSYWRRCGRQAECPDCKNRHLVSLESKAGQAMLENYLRAKK